MAYQGRFSQPRNSGEAILPQQDAAASKNDSEVRAKPVKTSGKTKKGNRTITLIFYTCYFVMIAALLVGSFFLNDRVTRILADCEAYQPAARCEEIFQTHFADPDWAALYRLAGLTDTEYEGSADFAACMEAKVGSRKLTYVEISPALSGEYRYLLKLDDETIGSFTLTDQAPEGADAPNWQLDKLVLKRYSDESVTIRTTKGITVYVNGVALTDDHVIEISTPIAQAHLPDGVHSPRIYTHYLDGLMVSPQVTATDKAGNPVDISYNEETGIYEALPKDDAISQEEYGQVLATARVYALFMIEKAGVYELGQYFDSSSQTYQTITGIDSHVQDQFFQDYGWGQEHISHYRRYSEELFSVHVVLPMYVTCADGTVREDTVDQYFLFEKQDSAWKCIHMTNCDMLEPASVVRLSFKLDDTTIFTNLFAKDINTLELPTVTAPEGQAFAGWFRLDTNADGIIQYTLVFSPEDDGVVDLPAGVILEPMTLYAIFEDTTKNGG